VDGYSIPQFRCEGVTCVGCGAVAERLQITEAADPTMESDPYGIPRPGPVERTFRFSPCGCRWIPGERILVEVTFGEFPEWMPEEARTAWNESGRAPVIAVAARFNTPAFAEPGVTIIEHDSASYRAIEGKRS
jgi:hypothetical protein